MLRRANGELAGDLEGPDKCTIPFRIGRILDISDRQYRLGLREYTPWIQVVFRTGAASFSTRNRSISSNGGRFGDYSVCNACAD